MRRILAGLALAFSLPLMAANQLPSTATAQANIQQFINVMVKKYHFTDAQLQKLLADRKPNMDIIRRITFPYESKPWSVYRSHFITPGRINGGVNYWNKHEKTLAAAEKKYGVPASVIVAIIGVESNYGSHAANFNELDALSTLAFYYPKRSKFFKKELKQYLILARSQKIDPRSLEGSYAGALGIPQFMPSSYRHYGVDFSRDGKIDLLNDHMDAIGSIANYLSENGWRRNQSVAIEAKLKQASSKRYLDKKPVRLSTWSKRGVKPEHKIKGNLRGKLIEMGKANSDYWLVFRNFKAIMSYNPRIPYAMAVYQLSREIKSAHDKHNA